MGPTGELIEPLGPTSRKEAEGFFETEQDFPDRIEYQESEHEMHEAVVHVAIRMEHAGDHIPKWNLAVIEMHADDVEHKVYADKGKRELGHAHICRKRDDERDRPIENLAFGQPIRRAMRADSRQRPESEYGGQYEK